MRLFVAVDVPDDVRDAVEAQVVGPLRDKLPGARWTRPEGRHLTIRFLGNVGEDRVPAVARFLGRAVTRHAPFDAELGDVGGFPSLGQPRVLWIGVERGADRLRALASDISAALDGLGFEPEDRPFQGHLTLARFKTPRVIEVPKVSVRLRPFRVEDVVVFRSHLHPHGARYEALLRFPLAG